MRRRRARPIGDTPTVELQRITAAQTRVIVKVEAKNPSGSVKDVPRSRWCSPRRERELREGSVIVEATAATRECLSADRGGPRITVHPRDARGHERRATPNPHRLRCGDRHHAGDEGWPAPSRRVSASSRGRATRSCRVSSTMQANRTSMRAPSARDPRRGADLAAFVAGVGTGGTLTGVGRGARGRAPRRPLVIAVEPTRSAVISGGAPGSMHPGSGSGVITKIFERALRRQVISVSDIAADKMVRRLAREEGFLAVVLRATCMLHAKSPRGEGPGRDDPCGQRRTYLFG